MPLSFSYPTENTPDTYWSVLHTHARTHTHTHSHTFRHLPPNSDRFGYATEGALFIAAVQRRGQRPPKGSGTNMTVGAT